MECEKILLTFIPILSVLTDFDNVRTFYKYFVYRQYVQYTCTGHNIHSL